MTAYISTRGAGPFDFATATLTGLAPDGGLMVPQTWPIFKEAEIAAMSDFSYQQLAEAIISRFTGDAFDAATLRGTITRAYQTFAEPDVTPLRPMGEGHALLELFHGPTLAFKDIALQWLGQVFDQLLQKESRKAIVIGATSGDTGSAAMAGCAACKNLSVFILYPHGRPSEIQRRQMTTLGRDNVHAIAIDGSFDDCQHILKILLADKDLQAKGRLLAVNSINWARVLAQVVYYFYAALRAGGPAKSVTFVVPTGNFGNIYAGYVASRLGLPIARLVAATNRNDAVHRFFSDGRAARQPTVETLSPSMDIQIPSNLERLLFELCARDSGKLQAMMREAMSGNVQVSPFQLGQARQIFTSQMVTDEETLATIKATEKAHGIVLDPHTAVGVCAAAKLKRELPEPVINLACAHPAKFPDVVKTALGRPPQLPEAVQALMGKTERFARLPPEVVIVKNHILRATGSDLI